MSTNGIQTEYSGIEYQERRRDRHALRLLLIFGDMRRLLLPFAVIAFIYIHYKERETVYLCNAVYKYAQSSFQVRPAKIEVAADP